jgi:hypothetical protein
MKYRKPTVKFRTTSAGTKVVAEKKKTTAWTVAELEVLKKQAVKNQAIVKRKAVKILEAQLAKKSAPEVQAILESVLKSVALGKKVPEKIVRAREFEIKRRDPNFVPNMAEKEKAPFAVMVAMPTGVLFATILLRSCQH